jgi:hypothetical protein
MQSLNQLHVVNNLVGPRSAWARRPISVRNLRTNNNYEASNLNITWGGVLNHRGQHIFVCARVGASYDGAPTTWPKAHQTGDVAPWQILDVNLFWRFLLTREEFWHETSSIGRFMKLRFQPYMQHPKLTSYGTWASFFVRAAPGLRTRLELELIEASALGTWTGLASCLLFDFDTLAGILLLQYMHQSWSYAWVCKESDVRSLRGGKGQLGNLITLTYSFPTFSQSKQEHTI